MPLITDSEMEDFDAAILQAGFEVDDFSVVDLDDEPTAKEQHPITGTVASYLASRMGKIGANRRPWEGNSASANDDRHLPAPNRAVIILRLGKGSDPHIYLWAGIGPSLALSNRRY